MHIMSSRPDGVPFHSIWSGTVLSQSTCSLSQARPLWLAQSSQPGHIPASTTAAETISRALRWLMKPSTDATSLSPGSSVSAIQVARNACLAPRHRNSA
jgi:hypothetical protein